MSDNGNDPSVDQQRPDQGFGVLGNLPRNRPSVRSPRRSDRVEAEAPAEEGAGEPAASHGAQPDHPHEISSTAELEALARTGIAIAGGAASLGLRIAGRAAAALRGAVDRT